MKRFFLTLAMMIATPLLVIAVLTAFAPLSVFERLIFMRFQVDELSASQVQARLSADNPPLLFDVREREEFEVSHIAGALHLPPQTSAERFLADHGAVIVNRDLVFYCSLGYRSSATARRLAGELGGQQVGGLFNLRGGVFGWYNQNRPLVNQNGPTKAVHPYADKWRFLLKK